jgi:4'-phosphopantetheinyl transferase
MEVAPMAERPIRLELPADEVHVWYASLETSQSTASWLATTLSKEEIDRANRFSFEQHRRQFIAGRGMLRAILAAYLGVGPSRVEIVCAEWGKPRLLGCNASLRFNLSHSEGLAAYALAWGREVGIDVEHVRPITDELSIARQHFSEREQNVLRNLVGAHRQRAFFRAWVRKEAWLKAVGTGLSYRLDRVEVTLGEDEPAQLLTVNDDASEAARWSLLELAPAFGYMGALAVAGTIDKCICRDFAAGNWASEGPK